MHKDIININTNNKIKQNLYKWHSVYYYLPPPPKNRKYQD